MKLLKSALNLQEHEVWLTIYNTSLTASLSKPEGAMAMSRAGGPPRDQHAAAADRAREGYRKACAP
jgi:hypothetical protein